MYYSKAQLANVKESSPLVRWAIYNSQACQFVFVYRRGLSLLCHWVHGESNCCEDSERRKHCAETGGLLTLSDPSLHRHSLAQAIS